MNIVLFGNFTHKYISLEIKGCAKRSLWCAISIIPTKLQRHEIARCYSNLKTYGLHKRQKPNWSEWSRFPGQPYIFVKKNFRLILLCDTRLKAMQMKKKCRCLIAPLNQLLESEQPTHERSLFDWYIYDLSLQVATGRWYYLAWDESETQWFLSCAEAAPRSLIGSRVRTRTWFKPWTGPFSHPSRFPPFLVIKGKRRT